ncbi:BatA domain-containing protein [Hymenobacter busanensis]|uniref:BatA domain-containing protein n=1 Tax=Hymenobacter busanensis TaxID=2607656 RepID=UPI001366ABEA|nr:BatA domain-containing protein [Hymenobacter busanensis]QHJ08538.1 hypothetical protein GUY19_15080 [Hymenobacter busanensis]
MLAFANPAALWALLGLLVPVAIHLWNRRPGQVVPVGALRWLTPGTQQRVSRLQLSQLPLLLLRLALLALLALAVAGPHWRQPPRPARPQVLLSPEVLRPDLLRALQPSLDSLRRASAEFRLFRPGLPLLPDSAFAKPGPTRLQQSSGAHTAYWPLAMQAAMQFPASPLRIISDNSQQHFRGTRPALPARLRWQLLPAVPDSAAWLHSAVRSTADSLVLTVAAIRGGNTVLRRYHQRWPAADAAAKSVPGLPSLHLVTVPNAGFAVQLDSTSTSAPDMPRLVPVQVPLQVLVYYDARSRAADARYAAAALRAASAAAPVPFRVRLATAPPAAADSLDWLFWLADGSPSPAWNGRLRQGLRLLTDARGPGTPTETSARTETGFTFQLRRSVPVPTGLVRWATGTGTAVLSYQPVGQGGRYRLGTRFHPAWSSLATDGQLPAALLQLLSPDTTTGPDLRALDPGQLKGLVATDELRPAGRSWELGPWLALLTGLLFCIERLVARRPTTAVHP